MRAFLVLLLLMMVVGLGACSEAPPDPVRVGSNVWPGYEPLYLARDLDAYPPDAVRLVEFPSSTEVIRAFRNRAVDVAALTLDEALLLTADGIEARVFLVMDISEGADAIVARPGIDDLAAFKDRPLGVEVTALGAFVLCRAAEARGLDCRDLNVVDVKIDEQVRAYGLGRIDGAVTFEPVRGRLLDAGAREIFDSSEIPGEIVDVLVVRAEAVDRHRAHLRALLEGWFAAVAHIRTAPDDAARRMAARQGVTPAAFKASLDDLRIPDAAEVLELMSGADPPLAGTMGELARIMARYDLLPRAPAPHSEILLPELVKDATR